MKTRPRKSVKIVLRNHAFWFVRKATGERFAEKHLVADCACCGSSDISEKGYSNYDNLLGCNGCADEDHFCHAGGAGVSLGAAVAAWNAQQWDKARGDY